MILSNIVLAWPNVPPRICHIWYYWYITAHIPNVVVEGIILFLRVHAMYGRNRKLLMGMTVFSSAVLVSGFIVIYDSARDIYSAPLPPGFTGCLGVSDLPYRYAYWIPTILFETLLFALAMYKSISIGLEHSSHLLFVLVRDSVMLYGGMLAVMSTNCLIWALGRPSLFSAFPSTFPALGSVLACRMILNAREAANPWYRYDSGLFGMSDIMSSLRFMTNSNPVAEEVHIEIQ